MGKLRNENNEDFAAQQIRNASQTITFVFKRRKKAKPVFGLCL